MSNSSRLATIPEAWFFSGVVSAAYARDPETRLPRPWAALFARPVTLAMVTVDITQGRAWTDGSDSYVSIKNRPERPTPATIALGMLATLTLIGIVLLGRLAVGLVVGFLALALVGYLVVSGSDLEPRQRAHQNRDANKVKRVDFIVTNLATSHPGSMRALLLARNLIARRIEKGERGVAIARTHAHLDAYLRPEFATLVQPGSLVVVFSASD